MVGLLDALIRNESGGRNIPNVRQGTSSGQAQGYFQITTGTWNEFGGQRYAPTPLQANYQQQADIASKIPLRRWDESTVASMKATGKPLDPNRTLGENLAANGESFAGGGGGGGTGQATTAYNPDEENPYQAMLDTLNAQRAQRQPESLLADDLASSVGRRKSSGGGGITPSVADGSAASTPATFDFASATPESPAPSESAGATEDAGAVTPLADIFKVKPIGIDEIDPYTGQQKMLKTRRTYG
jgi:hypothetical protein